LIRLLSKKLNHYTDFLNNILVLLNFISIDIDKKYLIIFADKINLEEFKSYLRIYLFRYNKSFFRLLNKNYLSFLANISELMIIKEKEFLYDNKKTLTKKNTQNILLKKKIDEICESIYLELKYLYNKSDSYMNLSKNNLQKVNNSNTNNSKNNYNRKSSSFIDLKIKYEIFIKNKKQFIDLHEVILRIGLNLTSNIELALSLYSCSFYDDIVNFLIFIDNENKIYNQNFKKNKKYLNLIEKYVKFNYKKSEDDAKKVLSYIVQNSIYILYEAYKCNFYDKTLPFNKIVIQIK
jgi:hypothetical protein